MDECTHFFHKELLYQNMGLKIYSKRGHYWWFKTGSWRRTSV